MGKRITIALAVVALIPIALYVTGYFSLCSAELEIGQVHWRLYPSQWIATLYWPIAEIDGLLRGEFVQAWNEARAIPFVG